MTKTADEMKNDLEFRIFETVSKFIDETENDEGMTPYEKMRTLEVATDILKKLTCWNY